MTCEKVYCLVRELNYKYRPVYLTSSSFRRSLDDIVLAGIFYFSNYI